MDEFGTLWVEASEQDGIITIRIRDDGKGFEISEKMEQNAKDERKEIGLRYVQMTLKSFYGEEAEINSKFCYKYWKYRYSEKYQFIRLICNGRCWCI